MSSGQQSMVAALDEFRAARDALYQETRDKLRMEALEAMRGLRGVVRHIEQRACGVQVVAPCPLAEMLHDVIGFHEVAHALVDLLRYSHDPMASDLRTKIANTYAEKLAPVVVKGEL